MYSEPSVRIEGERLRVVGPVKGTTVQQLNSAVRGMLLVGLKGLDLEGVIELDDTGAAWLAVTLESIGILPSPTETWNMPAALHKQWQNFLAPLVADEQHEAMLPPRGWTLTRALERLGELLQRVIGDLRDGLILTANTFAFSAATLLGRGRARRGSFRSSAVSMGVDALPVVLLISLLVGLVMALQSAAQLRRFGANIFVADLIGISMAREMGALMTAIVLAGRSGSAIAAEVATMVVTEETDALRSLGLDPTRFVLVPRFLALTLVTPLLALLATVVGIFGGMIAAVVYLDLAPQAFLIELVSAVEPRDITTSLIKSVAFAWVIAILGGFQGFRVRGGAKGVGRATTAAVVSSIFAVIVVDALASLVFYF